MLMILGGHRCVPGVCRWLTLVVLVVFAPDAAADIYRWDTGEVIPGTEGIVPFSGINLSGRSLPHADFAGLDLSSSLFIESELGNARFTSANLTGVFLLEADLGRADFTDAIVSGAKFAALRVGEQRVCIGCLTAEQLYATKSYHERDLRGIRLDDFDMAGWDFSGQDLTNAYILGELRSADFTGAIVAGASFSTRGVSSDSRSPGFTKEQLYSTTSYQEKDLQGIGLEYQLVGWDFHGQNLTGASLHGQLLNSNLEGANLTNARLSDAAMAGANLTDAVIVGANFGRLGAATPTASTLSSDQLYSTKSYRDRVLQGINLQKNDLTGWDFSGQDLTSANLGSAALDRASFAGATIIEAALRNTTSYGFNAEQLYSTMSYQNRDLRGMDLGFNNMSGWNLSEQNLTNVDLNSATLTETDFSHADLRGAFYFLTAASTRTRNLIWPNGKIRGLELHSGETLMIRDDDGLASEYESLMRFPQPITVEDQMTASDGGVLRVIFEADAWDSTISFEPGIPVSLGGTLELVFADDVHISTQTGRTIDVFDWTGVTPAGVFAVESPYVWDVSQLYTSGEVTFLAVPEPQSAVLLAIGLVIMAGLWRRGRVQGVGWSGSHCR